MKTPQKNTNQYYIIFIFQIIVFILYKNNAFAIDNPAQLLADKGKEYFPDWVRIVQLLIVSILVWDFFKAATNSNSVNAIDMVRKLLYIILAGCAEYIVDFFMSWGKAFKGLF